MKRILDKIAAIRTNPNAFEEWRDYRRQLTDVVIAGTSEGDTLAVYGAGSCNDIDLGRLAEHFSEITLLDLNEEAMKDAVRRRGSGKTGGCGKETASGGPEVLFCAAGEHLNLQRKQVILVDHNEKSQCVDGLEDAKVLEIVDHHRISSVQTIDPIRFRNRVVGSTATIIYHFYKVFGEVPTPRIAGLLLSAILSDTLAFRSPTCMPVDREMAQELAKIADVDIDELAQEMFEAGEDLTGETAEDVFFADFKKFSQSGVEFGVGQGSFMSPGNLEAARELLQDYIAEARAKAGLDMMFFMLTDIRKESSILLYDGEGAKHLIEEAFEVEAAGKSVFLSGVISRKKQLIPALVNTLRKM